MLSSGMKQTLSDVGRKQHNTHNLQVPLWVLHNPPSLTAPLRGALFSSRQRVPSRGFSLPSLGNRQRGLKATSHPQSPLEFRGSFLAQATLWVVFQRPQAGYGDRASSLC